MAELDAGFIFRCRKCGNRVSIPHNGAVVCESCRWQGEVHRLAPRAMEIRSSELAEQTDATCAHHPTKKAVTVCAGTGDYICALCAIELHGKTYSANYLENSGSEKLTDAYKLFLDRPDRIVSLYICLIFIPVINYVAIPLFPAFGIHGFMQLAKAKALRARDANYARVVGSSSIRNFGIALVFLLVLWVIGVAAVVMAIFSPELMGVRNGR